MNIALISLNQKWEDKNNNLLACEKYIKEAKLNKVDLIVFPEMTLTGFSINIKNIVEDEKNSQTIEIFRELAKQHNIAILFGIVTRSSVKALNKSIFVDNNGSILGKYSKIHPFSFSNEDKYFEAGSELTILNYMNIKIGLTICYDLRFPELYSSLAKNSDLIINIANWPKKRLSHWTTLLKARAIENQIYIAGVNRIGIDDNQLEYEESSNIYNANGEMIQSKEINEMKIFTINKEFTEEFKNSFNTTVDRKIEFYKGII